MNQEIIGKEIYQLAVELFPICRSITGDGLRETLGILQREVPELLIHEVPTGTECFDWTVPKEWNIRDAYVLDPKGKKVIDFKKTNLHLVSYSVPVDRVVPFEELDAHLHSLPNMPDAIPYVTSYYQEDWGFAMTHRERLKLKKGNYRVVIDSTLAPGSLTYGELVIPGETCEEVLLSSNICHPSMANNELSGPTVLTFLAKWLLESKRRYTYRLVFVPETIGALAYLSQNLDELKKNVIAGFTASCLGDDRTYSYIRSRKGDNLADRIIPHVLKFLDPHFKTYSWLERGSDERQYCSPGIDLPVASLSRSKYYEYPEYHTSKDDLSFISPEGLFGGYQALKKCLLCLEKNETLQVTVLGEPQLGRRNLYPLKGTKENRGTSVRNLLNLVSYCDGTKDLLEIAEILGVPMEDLFELVEVLKESGLLRVLGQTELMGMSQ